MVDMFFSKTQQELDADFLTAAGKHKFEKAKKLLEKGANVFAVDAEGNTALHKLAGSACRVDHMRGGDDVTKEFISLLLNKKIDINILNKQGKNCLHLVHDCSRYYYGWDYDGLVAVLTGYGANPNVTDLEGRTPLHDAIARDYKTPLNNSCSAVALINSGALINVRDNAGRTPLHVAIACDKEDVADLFLSSAVVVVPDSTGKFPHVLAADAGLHALARRLLEKFNAYQEAQKDPAPVEIPEPEPAASVPNDNWLLTEPEETAHVSVKKAIGYKLTEIFNFRERIYTKIIHNLETRSDASETRSFDDFADKALFVEAARELMRLGGKVDESAIHVRVLDKVKLKPLANN